LLSIHKQRREPQSALKGAEQGRFGGWLRAVGSQERSLDRCVAAPEEERSLESRPPPANFDNDSKSWSGGG